MRAKDSQSCLQLHEAPSNTSYCSYNRKLVRHQDQIEEHPPEHGKVKIVATHNEFLTDEERRTWTTVSEMDAGNQVVRKTVTREVTKRGGNQPVIKESKTRSKKKKEKKEKKKKKLDGKGSKHEVKSKSESSKSKSKTGVASVSSKHEIKTKSAR